MTENRNERFVYEKDDLEFSGFTKDDLDKIKKIEKGLDKEKNKG